MAKRILVLDDNHDILDIVHETLTYEQFEVQSTSRSETVIPLVETFSPNLVILDYKVAGANGGEICRQIKSHPDFKDIPVIIFSADILEVLQFILEDSGYEVDTLSDGRFLFEKINAKAPDLILLDIMLGNMDGRELCKDIKSNDETQKIPVILVSASHNIADTINKKGAPNAFIAKPFDIDELLDAIRIQLPAA
eukprot:gene3766-3812_t